MLPEAILLVDDRWRPDNPCLPSFRAVALPSECVSGVRKVREEKEEGNHIKPSSAITMGPPCLRLVEKGALPRDCCFLLSGVGWGPVFCHRLQGPDCRGLMVMAPAFVKRRRWLTAMIQKAGRSLPGDRDSLCRWHEVTSEIHFRRISHQKPALEQPRPIASTRWNLKASKTE